MRPLSELISEAKFEANVEKSQRFTDEAMIRIMDTAQRQIQMVIYNAYPQDPIFADCLVYDRNEDNKYKLPLKKMLTPNSIHALMAKSSSGLSASPLARIGILEKRVARGYYIIDGFAHIANGQNAGGVKNGIELYYARILPRLTALDQTSELPTMCEEFMVQWAVRKIHFINSSQDIANSQVFTAQQRQDIADLFADAARDPKYIPTLNSDYLAY